MIDFANVKSVSIPEGTVTKIQFLQNLVSGSIDANGNIYNGCGYKDGYRMNSSGVEKEYNDAYYKSTTTGYISVVKGDVLYIDGCNWLNYEHAFNYICGYDAEFNFIGAEYSLNVNNNICYGTKFISHVTGDKLHARAVLMNNTNVAYVRVSCRTPLLGQTISGADIRVSTLSSALTAWKKYAYTNQVLISIDTDGSIYNGTGYKNGYRIRSGGAELATNPATSRITGFIPVKAGDIVRFYGWNFSYKQATNAVNFSDASFTNIGQFTAQPASYGICLNNIPTITVEDDVYSFIVPNNADIHYMRVTAEDGYNNPPDDMIITVNEEIK